MGVLSNDLDSIVERVRLTLSAKDEAREKAMPLCRDAIRHCSEAIRAVHRQEFDRATELLSLAHNLLSEAQQVFVAHSEFSNTGFLRDAQKEYAEGRTFLALVTGVRLPDPLELCIDVAAYLNGLGEAVGELRRYLLDNIRRGDLSRCEELLLSMDDIYSVLVTIDFPDAITGGLRRTTDMVRGVLEKTRSDLTLVMRQKDLENKIEKFEGDIS